MRSVSKFSLTAAAALPLVLWADMTGADPRLTGAPGDDQAACTSCHTGTRLNGGGGSLRIILPGDATYTPGVKQRMKVEVSDSVQRRWGFEFTARLASDLRNGQAGDLASTDGNTRVICDNGRPKPCASTGTVQFITHTQSGTRNGTAGPMTFEFDWTPPEADVGKVVLYAAGNAANGNNLNTGDHIYTTSLELTPAVVTPKPSISSERGVLNAASRQAAIAQNSWITIAGTNLSTITRTWTTDEIASGKLPASLDNVSVTVNGKPAYVQYISPTQINALTPADDALGPVEVRVTSNGQSSDPSTVTMQSFAPAFFTLDGKHVATAPGNNTMLDQSAQFFASDNSPAALKPGDTIVLYGTGFGATDPAATAGQVPDSGVNLAAPVNVMIGDFPATVSFAGLVAGLPQIYELDVQIPDGLADGEYSVVVEIGGVSSPSGSDCCYITVQR